MKASFTIQLWISIKIWLIAIAANSLLGAFYLTVFFSRSHSVMDFLIMGTAYGAFFSFPVMVILLIIINRCIAAGTKGLALFRIVLMSGVVLTVIVFMVFWLMIGGNKTEMTTLLCLSVLSAIIAIASQYKALLKAGSEFPKHTTISHEN